VVVQNNTSKVVVVVVVVVVLLLLLLVVVVVVVVVLVVVLIHFGLAGFRRLSLTVQALIHFSVKNFHTVRYMLGITAFCIRRYRAGRGLSSFKLSCSFFG